MADLERLIDQIYEAAANADLWPQVLHHLGQSVDAAGGIILVRRSDAWLGWRYSDALAPGADALFSGDYRSQATERLLNARCAGFVTEEELFSDEEYLADPLMTEWCTPAGLHHATATAIPMQTGDLVVLHINRRAGQRSFGGEDIARLDALRPHLARAGMLAARWRLERLRAASEALAMIGLPAAILDASGTVLAANRLIEAMSPYLVWLPKDRIALTDDVANALLRRAISDIANPAAATVRSFPSKGTDGKRVVVHLIPATGEARDLFGGGFGILAITPVAALPAPDVTLIRGLFDLTAAEARVATAIAEGLSPEKIAERQGTTPATVRGQLKSIFAKTGVNRQSQLAALLAMQPRILRDPRKDPTDEDL